jgi:2-keto-3-deoxy-L-rhamnonate aldolase RhmA
LAEAADLVRAAKMYDVTPWIRLEAYPWSGGVDPHLHADAARALSIGFEVVMVSLDSAEEVAAVVPLQREIHRRWYIVKKPTTPPDIKRDLDALEAQTMVIPLIESLNAARTLDKIMAVPGLRAVALGMGDLSRVMGHPGEPHHPELQAFVRSAVELGRARRVRIVGLAGSRTDHQPEVVLSRVRWLRDLGVDITIIPWATLVVQDYYERTLALLRDLPRHKSEPT